MSQSGRFTPGIAPGTFVETLTGNTGGPVPPDGAGNINIVGDGTTIEVVGNPGTNTLTIEAGSGIATTYVANSGTASPFLGDIDLLGTSNITTTASGHTVDFALSGTTDHAVQLGNAGGSLTSLANGTTGEVLTAQTGADPIWAAPSASGIVTIDGDVGFATGTTITLTGGTSGAVFTGDDVSTITESFNFLQLPVTTSTNGQILIGPSNPILHAAGGASNNIFLGADTGNFTLTGAQNTALGPGAGVALTTGNFNVLVGSSAGLMLDAGVGNVIIGWLAGENVTSGSGNIIIDPLHFTPAYTTESNNIIISGTGYVGDSNAIHIGDGGPGNYGTCFIGGIDLVDVGSTAKVVTMGSNGAMPDQLGTAVITAGSGITITPGANLITISASGSSSISITGNSGGALTGNAFTFTGGTTGLTFAGAGSTETLGGTLVVAHGGTAATSFNTTGVVISGATSTTALAAITLTDGQLAIGSSAGNPAAANLTAGNNIAITNGNNSISIAANTAAQVAHYTGVNHAASPYTILSTDYYISADVTAGVISILLPNAPTTGRTFVVKDKVGLAATSNITITTVGGAVNIDGATSFVMNTAYQSVQLIFNGSTYEIY